MQAVVGLILLLASDTGAGLLDARFDISPIVADKRTKQGVGAFSVVNTGSAKCRVKKLTVVGSPWFIYYGGSLTTYPIDPGAASGFSITFTAPDSKSHTANLVAEIQYDADELYRLREALIKQHKPAIDRLRHTTIDMRKSGPDLKPINLREVRADLDFRKAEAGYESKIAALDKQLRDLKREKELALKELREGYFCSKCKRSKSEIERGSSETFEEHLGRVSGDRIPASPEQIAAKEKEYDDKIATAQRTLAAAQKSLTQLRADQEQKTIDFARARERLQDLYRMRIAELEGELSRRDQTLQGLLNELKALEAGVKEIKATIHGRVE